MIQPADPDSFLDGDRYDPKSLMSNGSIPGSWREAAAHAGVPVTSLRAAIKRGDVPAPVIGEDGATEWDIDALDALREARASAKPTVSLVIAEGPSSGSPVPSAIAQTNEPLAWAFAAAAGGVVERDDDRDDEDDDVDTGIAGAAPRPWLPPLGASPTFVPIESWASLRGIVANDTHSQRVTELEQQLADLQAQLAVATSERDRWQRLYVPMRIKSIADAIAHEAMTATGDPQIANVAAHAAAQAVAALPIEQLVADAAAVPLARHAGHQAGSAWAAIAQAQPGGANDIDRARNRRSSHRR